CNKDGGRGYGHSRAVIAGLATAVALKRVGIRALVIEKSEGLRATGATLNQGSLGTSGAALRVVHRKALLEALAAELPMDTIRFSSKLASIRTKAQKGSSIALIQMEDGTTIRAKGPRPPQGATWLRPCGRQMACVAEVSRGVNLSTIFFFFFVS
ncbi:monooxygenase 3, partial [Quercus suber]